MAARPGEENVATLFGDIHYFYGPDTVKPRHHRFDKGSYVYLFENATERRCRIEVANQPGMDDQDAFDGFLDQTQVRYSYKHHCMVSLTVADAVNQSEWHLPTYDPRNENKYHYKLHSMDIYFWKQQDALQFVNGVRRVLPPSQVEVLDEPAPPGRQQQQQPQQQTAGMSSVVQKLEHAAISDPQYHGEKQGAVAAAPPISAVASDTTSTSIPPPPPPPGQPTNYAPIAYNPAAPAAPETIRHREKTPPPEDDPLNPLAVAVAYDYQKQPFTPGYPPQAQFPPGIMSPGLPPAMKSPGVPPQHPGMARAATMPVQGGMASPGLSSPYGSGFPGSPGMPPPPGPPPAPQHSHSQPQVPQSTPPPGGYSNYSYGQHPQPGQPRPGGGGGQDYSIHQQLYRPSEGEAAAQYNPKQDPKGRLEENAGRLERGMTGMLKKFEKKFG